VSLSETIEHCLSWLIFPRQVFLPVNVLNAIKPDLADFGQQVLSKQTLDWVIDSEKNVPYLKGSGRDAFGKRTSELVVGEGWRKLQEYGISQGYVADLTAILDVRSLY
jgi:hypothetical protein